MTFPDVRGTGNLFATDVAQGYRLMAQHGAQRRRSFSVYAVLLVTERLRGPFGRGITIIHSGVRLVNVFIQPLIGWNTRVNIRGNWVRWHVVP